MDLQQHVLNTFEESFGKNPEYCFQAPGRVNLIGEHTDYNDGFVLPCAIDYQTMIAASPRNDNKVVVVAADYQHQQVEFDLALPVPKSRQAFWSNYVCGVAQVLMEKGHNLQGANMVIAGNVPQGAGLSSSASLGSGYGYDPYASFWRSYFTSSISLNRAAGRKPVCGLQLRHYGSDDFRLW